MSSLFDFEALDVEADDLHVGFTGTQEGMTPEQKITVKSVLTGLAPGWFHHGWCIGADAEADVIARELGFKIIGHPPISVVKLAHLPEPDVKCVPRKYLDRNTDIALASSIVVAAPKGYKEEHYSGTWSTVRRARKYSEFIIIAYPNGTWEVEVIDGYATT